MTLAVSPHHYHHHHHFRVGAFAACGRLGLRFAGGGRCHNNTSSGGAQAISVARRGSHGVDPPNVTSTAPLWMTSPLFPRAFREQPLQRSTANALCASAGKNIIAAVENGGLLVRGGGGGVVASAPLGALVVVTAYLTSELERRTKLGAIVGSPLLSFASFCLLR